MCGFSQGLNSMQSQVKELEEDVASHKSFLDKIRRIALEEDKKRFRSGLVTSALESTVAVGQIGDALVELIQKCLFDDDNEKKMLQSTLDRVNILVLSRDGGVIDYLNLHVRAVHKSCWRPAVQPAPTSGVLPM